MRGCLQRQMRLLQGADSVLLPTPGNETLNLFDIVELRRKKKTEAPEGPPSGAFFKWKREDTKKKISHGGKMNKKTP